MPSSRRLLAGLAILAAFLAVPALRAAPVLASGLWRYTYHVTGPGQNMTHTLVHCYTSPHAPQAPHMKGCAVPVLHVKGSTARWVLACSLDGGQVRFQTRGTVVYLDGGNAFREDSVSRVTMPFGTRVYETRVTGQRIGACSGKP